MRTQNENEWLGGFERIYPATDPERSNVYKTILTKAKSIWIESTSGPTNKKISKAKSDNVKSPSKNEKGSKKPVVSPIKKTYSTTDPAKLKVKSSAKTSAAKPVDRVGQNLISIDEKPEAIISERKIDNIDLQFSATKNDPSFQNKSMTPMNIFDSKPLDDIDQLRISHTRAKKRNENHRNFLFSDSYSFHNESPKKLIVSTFYIKLF